MIDRKRFLIPHHYTSHPRYKTFPRAIKKKTKHYISTFFFSSSAQNTGVVCSVVIKFIYLYKKKNKRSKTNPFYSSLAPPRPDLSASSTAFLSDLTSPPPIPCMKPAAFHGRLRSPIAGLPKTWIWMSLASKAPLRGIMPLQNSQHRGGKSCRFVGEKLTLDQKRVGVLEVDVHHTHHPNTHQHGLVR